MLETAPVAASSFEDALAKGELWAASLDVREALYDGVKMLVAGTSKVAIVEVDLTNDDARAGLGLLRR